MSLSSGGGTVTASAALLPNLLIPPGPCAVTLSNSGTASPVWFTFGGTTAAAGNGLPVPSGVTPVTITGFQGGGGCPVHAVTGGGTAVIGWVISTAAGGTGP